MKLRMFAAVTAAASVYLLGCATQAQREAVGFRQGLQAVQLAYTACVTQVYNSTDYEPLRAHMPFNVLDATLQQETDSSLISDEEINVLLVVHPRTQECRKALVSQMSAVTPTFAPIYAESFLVSENAIIELAQRRIAWGEYIQRLRRSVAETQSKLVAEAQQIDDRFARANAEELARRQAALNAFAQYYQNQQLINSINRTRTQTTTCTAFGNTVNCTGISQ